MTKHTPGPLQVYENDGAYVKEPALARFAIEQVNGISTALVLTDTPGLDRGEAKANAYLYAAAPDLLEAARAMLAMYEKFMAKANHGASAYDADTIRALNDAPISARAAIAKAEGPP